MISWFERHNRICWIVVVIIAGIIFYISSLTFEPGTGGEIKAIFYHLFAFFFLAAFLLMALVRGGNRRFVSIAVVGAILYGITDELHQFFVPGRQLSLGDVFIDTVGITFATIIYFISLEYRKKRKY